MRKTLEKLFAVVRKSALDAGTRGVGLILLLALVTLAPQGAEGYTKMGNDRILLMNNDNKFLAKVQGQGYYDTNTTADTYWVHGKGNAPILKPAKYLLAGTNHVMYAKDGTKYWDLRSCRAGSATVVGSTARNYIPWSKTALSILSPFSANISVSATDCIGVGSVVLRNDVGACLYSPHYDEGIGTIYFDAVNSFVNATSTRIVLEIATNLVESAKEEGKSFSRELDENDVEWKTCPFCLFTVTGSTLNLIDEAATNVTLASTAGGSELFYRIRAQLNYRNPIRFRIRRENVEKGTIDAAGLVQLDNIIASYPPMTAELCRYGKDYDTDLEGSCVLGTTGDFNQPFLNVGGVGLLGHAYCKFIRNSASTVAAKIKNARMMWRWRYLNQVISPFRALPFSREEVLSTDLENSNLVTSVGISLDNGIGDIEYYFTAELDAPYYYVKDYAFYTEVGYGAGWSEAITAITNRGSVTSPQIYNEENLTPACGTDYFVRIREAESPFEWVKLCTSVTTNELDVKEDSWGAEEEVRMELVNTNTWRYCYYVSTNDVGRKLKFHFTGKKLFTDPANPFAYASTNFLWKCDLSAVPYLPYTSVAGEDYAHDVTVTLDKESTHLIIEFNDQLLSYSVSHGTYQNFNVWTDALQGYRGNARYDEENPTNGASATGVSDTKTKFEANMADWELQGYSDPYWTEDFNTSDDITFPLYTSFDTSVTPLNGWEAGHGQWIRGARGSATSAAPQEEVSLQMEGRGQGYVALDKESGMPAGIGTVTFKARVAQEPRFDDFAVYGDGSTLTDYAVSAQLTMSRERSATWNPTDISPSQPSVSLIGRYREKKGCYEYRISRTASDQLTCALYKWRPSATGMAATLLASNVITSVNNAAYAKPGSGQTAFYNFQNMLVPGSSDNVNASWTSAYLFMFTKGDGSVYIECMLSNSRNSSSINAEARSNQKKVLVYTDENAPFLKGSYGVGSTDCNAGFGAISYHEPADAGDYAAGINYAGTTAASDISAGDWAYYADRWNQPGSKSTEWGLGSLNATMPTNQTIRLQFKDDAHGWFDSGYEVAVSSFSTNSYAFAPCVSPDYKVRLISGGHTYDEVRTDVVVDDIEITSWRAADYPNLSSTGGYGMSKQWVYTAATLESSAEVTGPGTPSVGAAGTNGYTFAFTVPGTYTFVPQMDLTIDRLLLVGGGGAGGWTLGGGGGGGGVLDYDYGTNTITLAKGSQNIVIVGGGGDNYYVANNDSKYWKAGGNGGSSQIVFKDANTGKSYSLTVKGGGGGAGWNQRNAASGNATGGGAAQGNDNGYYSSRATGTTGQGNSGGRAYGDRAGGGGGAALDESGMGEDANATKNGAGDGGAGRASDITGTIVYYGGGGGGGGGDGNKTPNSAAGGAGGLGGGGTGLDAKAQSRPENLNGEDGLGGGGGGGSHSGAAGTNAGGKGGSGAVILRLKTSSKVCTLQPARGTTDEAMGLRSPYLAEGLSMFSFSYANANSNCVLWLQVVTNDVIEGESSMSASLTKTPPDDSRWKTVAEFAFTNKVSSDLFSGTCSHFMSLRAPYRGYMRLVVATNVMQYCADHEGPDRDVDYGKITITKIHCYNEPPLDLRSWWGWNMHTEGWNTPDKQYAYLFDSPDGLSASLNFSALARDNKESDPDTRGIGLTDPELEQEYQSDNSFIQCPPLMSGIGTVTFRARTFTTNQSHASYVTLYGTSEPDSYQVEVPDDWKKLATYKITNTTYQTFKWSTTDDSTKHYAIRLEVDGSRWGRTPSSPDAWEKPKETPIQRVWIDEVTASEPIAPRIVFRDVRPFRSHLTDVPPKPVTNVTDLSEQPILGESWGIQATVEPQQMSDELVTTTVVVYAAFYRGISPWGYTQWSNKVTAVRLEQVASNLVFRSTYNNASSIIGPDMTPSGTFPNSVWQYYVWAEYEDKQGVRHVHGLDSTEWTPPSWYYGIKDLNEKYGLSGIGEKFAGYTILDSISPQRAWLNEVNICDTGTYNDYSSQFIEIAVPQNADLTDWRIDIVDSNVRRGTIAQFGAGNASITSKTGSKPGVDNTNHYTFVALRSPGTAKAGNFAEADGAWQKTPSDTADGEHAGESTYLAVSEGDLRYYSPYGVELVRPSGIIEHQVVIQGTNTYEGHATREYINSGTNLLRKIVEVDGEDSHWFFAGKDFHSGTLGVFKRHGEDASCWTNRMQTTVGALNKMEDGTLQMIDPLWFLQPNGTNVWIYATVLGSHIHQTIGNSTNDSTVLVIRKGLSTNILYRTDAWYQIGSATTNDVPVAGAQGRGGRTEGHTWTLRLDNVQETIDVKVDEEPSQDVQDLGLDKNDAYYNAIMAWLRQFDDTEGLQMAEQWNLANEKVGDLDIKDMYWLNINPVEGDWVLKAGMGTIDGAHTVSAEGPALQEATVDVGASLQAVAPVAYEDTVHGSLTNVQMYVTMQILNKNSPKSVMAPDRIQGIEPGSSSYDYDGKTNNWGSATFKICGALQKEGVKNDFYPLRWFVFGPNSFDSSCRAKIEISDPHSKSSPGYFNGWSDYPTIPVFYKWKLNAEPAWYDTVELLKPDSTYNH